MYLYMSISPSLSVSTPCPFFYPSHLHNTFPNINKFIYRLSFFLFVYLHIFHSSIHSVGFSFSYLSIYVSIYLLVCLSIYLRLSISVYLFIYLYQEHHHSSLLPKVPRIMRHTFGISRAALRRAEPKRKYSPRSVLARN